MKRAICLFILIVLFSCSDDKIPPGASSGTGELKIAPPSNVVSVQAMEMAQTYEAVGTIRPLTESVIESRISSQVEKVMCVPGARVKKGQDLLRLDSASLMARKQQAAEGLKLAENNLKQTYKSMDAAKAGLDQAQAEYNRSKKLFDSGIITSQKLEIDRAGFLKSKANLEKVKEAELAAKVSIKQARERLKEVEIGLGYAMIKSPSDGVVVKRMVDPGDQAVPGKPLLVLQTSGALRIEANVREGLINRVVLGNEYDINIKAIGKMVTSVVEEIIPYADPETRTFIVKASIPQTSGVYPGMFGRLLIPLEKQTTLLIPRDAVTHVGQLELVKVKKGERWENVYVKTGRSFDSRIEILSGLSPDEIIGYN